MVKGQWKQIINNAALQRSSHNLTAIDGDGFVFGGELIPRQPRDNKILKISSTSQNDSADSGFTLDEEDQPTAPSPRVGAATTSLQGKLYLFSGRGGLAMAPVEEHGRLHVYDPSVSSWTTIDPADRSAPYPPARSYHAMTSDQSSSVFVHAGCPENGRLADLWQFNIATEQWLQLPNAPGPARGGTNITYLDGKLYRMNGFDGRNEIGGVLDVFDVLSQQWSTYPFSNTGQNPSARSVSMLLPIKIGDGDKLVTLFGEQDPSSLGHAGAGRMLADWWIYDIKTGLWEQGEDDGVEKPVARGWFGADVVDSREVMVIGGLGEDNERLGDGWVLSL